MIQNLRSELRFKESVIINEFKFVIYTDNNKVEVSGKGNTIPWDSLPESCDDINPNISGWVSFDDDSWVELEETSVMGDYYYDWVYHERPRL